MIVRRLSFSKLCVVCHAEDAETHSQWARWDDGWRGDHSRQARNRLGNSGRAVDTLLPASPHQTALEQQRHRTALSLSCRQNTHRCAVHQRRATSTCAPPVSTRAHVPPYCCTSSIVDLLSSAVNYRVRDTLRKRKARRLAEVLPRPKVRSDPGAVVWQVSPADTSWKAPSTHETNLPNNTTLNLHHVLERNRRTSSCRSIDTFQVQEVT